MDALPDQEHRLVGARPPACTRSYLPRFRRVAREKLARISSPEVAIGVADAARSLPPHARYDVLWAVASMPCRADAAARARDGCGTRRSPAAEKTALLNGLRLAVGLRRALADRRPPAHRRPGRSARRSSAACRPCRIRNRSTR